jgi:hypothetical protein
MITNYFLNYNNERKHSDYFYNYIEILNELEKFKIKYTFLNFKKNKVNKFKKN